LEEKGLVILAITGHRPHKLGGYFLPNPVYNAVMTKLEDSLRVLQPSCVLTGMALGVDQWTAQLCVNLLIPFDAVIAFENYEAKWPQDSKNRYRHLLTKARKIHMVSPGGYSPSKLHQRNYWMVDHSDALLAVWDGLPGSGTSACVQYAQLQSPPKPAYRLDLASNIWAMAKTEEELLNARRAEREEFKTHLNQRIWENSPVETQPVKQPPRPKPESPETFQYRRVIDVGEDDS
jgi:uncharacterized phage-like protein YoqJ